jgi:hypothetical protein
MENYFDFINRGLRNNCRFSIGTFVTMAMNSQINFYRNDIYIFFILIKYVNVNFGKIHVKLLMVMLGAGK